MEKKLVWKRNKSIALKLDRGQNFLISQEDLIDENNKVTAFLILKKWSEDQDGVTYKKPTKFFIKKEFWNEILKAVDELNLPN